MPNLLLQSICGRAIISQNQTRGAPKNVRSKAGPERPEVRRRRQRTASIPCQHWQHKDWTGGQLQYACQGCYLFASKQALYSENYRYYKENTAETLAATIVDFIDANSLHLFRYFTCGDIPGAKFLDAVVLAAIARPNVKYWLYTKKYHIVNQYLDDKGADVIPANVSIIFSHWMNDDGTYFPMPNPYGFQTSEFIPLGHEDMAERVTHICPCSDPTVKATCATCSHPCYDLKRGESMALLEHSTQRTKERDRAIKAAKAAL